MAQPMKMRAPISQPTEAAKAVAIEPMTNIAALAIMTWRRP